MAACAPDRRPVRPLVAALLLVAAVMLALPARALARDYQIDSVRIDATVSEDGVLAVTETRTFDFDGSFSGVYWDVPAGRNEASGRDVSVRIVSAGEGLPGSLVAFEPSTAGLDGTFEVSEVEGDVLRVKLYAPHEDERASFTLSYEASGVVTRWDDVAELYWKFVSDGWDVESQDVTCVLHLPVPEGAALAAGESVRAWGHGPLDASVEFSGDEIVFTVPGVGTDEFAEMRVTFPRDWVGGLEATAGERLPQVLSEEQAWADEANARRDRARLAIAAAVGGALALAAASAGVALWRRARYRSACTPRFADTYYRDVPTTDHPAVLGALIGGGDAGEKDLSATLMHLTDDGVVRLERERTTRRGILGERAEETCRLVRVRRDVDASGSDAPSALIDRRALELVFAAADGGAGDAVLFSELKDYAKAHPQAYSDAYNAWKGAVEGACLERFSGTGEHVRGKGALIALAIADWVLAVIALVALLDMGAHPAAVLGAPVALAVAGGALMWAASTMRDLSPEAIEVRAELEALERWLRDFTRLEEAVPTDVVLWRRLLVMAVALGVADEVIEQLRVSVPEVLDDPHLMPTYGWLIWHGRDGRTPAAALAASAAAAHEVSTAALAESDDSMGSGGGGGFSSGGGGGFGGGGGGGAF